MVTKTGEGSDVFLFDPTTPTTERWVDEGGIDILALVNYNPLTGLQMWHTDTAIKVRIGGSTLVIPNDADGFKSVEILEWREPTFNGSTPTIVEHRLGIITDTALLTKPGFVFVGSSDDEVITLPKSGKSLPWGSDIFAAGGDDVITLTTSYETHSFGGAGNDVIRAMGKPDTVQYGNTGRDKLIGADGNDTLIGGLGNDKIRGGMGDDILEGDDFAFFPGSGGRDRMFGGAGDDILSGGNGSDTMTGGRGSDTFSFQIGQTAGRPDVITDFSASEDTIAFDKHTLRGNITARVENGDTILSFRGSDFVVLEDVVLARSDIDIDLL